MSPSPSHVLLFGGSFNPVHQQHVAMAEAARRQGPPGTELWWVPAGQPWQKPEGLVPAPHRLAMLERALQGLAGHRLCTLELERTGPSYAVHTVRALQALHPHTRFSWLLGEDQLLRLTSWFEWSRFLALVRLVVVRRPRPVQDGSQDDLQDDDTTHQVHPDVKACGWDSVQLTESALSSSAIRQALLDGLPPPEGALHPEVARYIAQHGLYTAPTHP